MPWTSTIGLSLQDVSSTLERRKMHETTRYATKDNDTARDYPAGKTNKANLKA